MTAEVGGYIVQARREDAWDAIVTLLHELSADGASCFHAMMGGCRRLSNAGREEDGLDDLLDAPEQLLHDVAVERDSRRAERGFITAADALAFLALRASAARGRRANALPSNGSRGPMPPPSGRPPADRPRHGASPRGRVHRAAPLDPAWPTGSTNSRVCSWRRSAAGPFAPPPGRPDAGPGRTERLEPLMEYLVERHPDLCLTRGQELTFLANILVAGSRLQSRSFSAREASNAVVATCSFGLLRQPAPPGATTWSATTWSRYSKMAGRPCIARCRSSSRNALLAVLRAVRRRTFGDSRRSARAPAVARDAPGGGDAVAGARGPRGALALDTSAWYGLLGLLSECPVIPEVVSAIVERRAGRTIRTHFPSSPRRTISTRFVRSWCACRSCWRRNRRASRLPGAGFGATTQLPARAPAGSIDQDSMRTTSPGRICSSAARTRAIRGRSVSMSLRGAPRTTTPNGSLVNLCGAGRLRSTVMNASN